jgi:hypothetical protein
MWEKGVTLNEIERIRRTLRRRRSSLCRFMSQIDRLGLIGSSLVCVEVRERAVQDGCDFRYLLGSRLQKSGK